MNIVRNSVTEKYYFNRKNRLSDIVTMIIFQLLLLFSAGNAQQNSVLAVAGGQEITSAEFKFRFELMPHFTDDDDDNPDSMKVKFLYSLVAEKLWAMQAETEGIANLQDVVYSLKTLKKFFLRDELYKKMIDSKIKITGKEIINGLHKYGKTLFVNVIFSADSVEIKAVYRKLNDGADFDSLLSSRNESKLQQDQLKIRFGQLKSIQVEDTLFAMKPGDFSPPLKTDDGWMIFKLRRIQIDTITTNSEEHIKNIVVTTLRERKEKNLTNAFVNKLLSGQKIETDGKLFDDLVKRLYNTFSELINKPDSNMQTGYLLTERDVKKIINSYSSSQLHSHLILFRDNPVPLIEYLYYLMYEKFQLSGLSKRKVAVALNKSIKHFIEEEVLVREARRLGMQNLSSVKKDIARWRESYLSQMLMQMYVDTIKISKNDLYDYYKTKYQNSSSDIMVNVREILVDNLSDVEMVLNKLDEGEDFGKLAKVYSKNEYAKDTGGKLGFFSSSLSGVLGKAARSLNIGEIYGPVKVPQGYAIIKLIDKKEIKDSQLVDFNNVKNQLRMELRYKKINDLLNNETISLANKYGVKILNNNLRSLSVKTTNTFTYRLIGFGGKITALPLTIPMYEWYYRWEAQKKEIP